MYATSNGGPECCGPGVDESESESVHGETSPGCPGSESGNASVSVSESERSALVSWNAVVSGGNALASDHASAIGDAGGSENAGVETETGTAGRENHAGRETCPCVAASRGYCRPSAPGCATEKGCYRRTGAAVRARTRPGFLPAGLDRRMMPANVLSRRWA